MPAWVRIAVDSSVTFLPLGECAPLGKRKATLTWSGSQFPVRAGMNVDQTCAVQLDYRTGARKVTRCAPGTVILTVYTDSVGTSVLQTIVITDEDSLP